MEAHIGTTTLTSPPVSILMVIRRTDFGILFGDGGLPVDGYGRGCNELMEDGKGTREGS